MSAVKIDGHIRFGPNSFDLKSGNIELELNFGGGSGGGGSAVEYASGPIATVGATRLNYGNLMLPVFYDADNDRTRYVFEGWNGGRTFFSTWVDHATGLTGPVVGAGVSPLVDDDHGNPSNVLDYQGHEHVFGGTHSGGGALNHASTDLPWSNSAARFVDRGAISGGADYTYTKPHAIGSGLQLLARNSASGVLGQCVLRATSALNDGEATWASEVILIDVENTNDRFYSGNTIIRNTTEIHFAFCIADSGDTTREHVYYAIYDHDDGSVSTWDKSTTVSSGSLPVDRTQLDTDFRIFDHTGGNDHIGGVPVLAFSTADVPHVLFMDDTAIPGDMKHMYVDGSSWTTPAVIEDASRGGMIGPLPDGEMEVLFGYIADTLQDVYRRVRSSGGTWGDREEVIAATTVRIGNMAPSRGADPDARWAFSEAVASGSADSSAGGFKAYLWGDSGLLGRNEPGYGDRTDPHIDDVVLLLNPAQDTGDLSPAGQTVVWDTGDTNAPAFNEIGVTLEGGSRGRIEDSTDFRFGSDDFAIEYDLTEPAISGDAAIGLWLSTGNQRSWAIRSEADGKVSAFGSSAGASADLFSIASTAGTVSDGIDARIALVRSGTTVRLFVNGVMEAFATSVSGSLHASTGRLTIGDFDNGIAAGAGPNTITGSIKAIRVTSGNDRNADDDGYDGMDDVLPLPTV